MYKVDYEIDIEKPLRRIASTIALIANHARNIHWNIEGEEFFELHYETEKLYDRSDEFLDQVAEKMIQRYFLPPAAFGEFLANSDLKDLPSQKWRLGSAGKRIVDDIEVLFKELAAIDGKTSAFIQPMIDDITMYYDKVHWQFTVLIK